MIPFNVTGYSMRFTNWLETNGKDQNHTVSKLKKRMFEVFTPT